MGGGSAPGGCCGSGDRVRFDGRSHTVVGLDGRLRSGWSTSSGSTEVVMLAHLLAAEDFELVDCARSARTGCLPPFGLLDRFPNRR